MSDVAIYQELDQRADIMPIWMRPGVSGDSVTVLDSDRPSEGRRYHSTPAQRHLEWCADFERLTEPQRSAVPYLLKLQLSNRGLK